MQKKFRIRHILYIALLACLLLGSSQAGMVSAERDEWSAEETGEETLAVKPVPGFAAIPISTLTHEHESKPVVAHGGEHYLVVYIRGLHIYARAVHINISLETAFLIDSDPTTPFSSPSVAYHPPSGLFLVAYHRCDFATPQNCSVRVTAVSATGIVGAGVINVYNDARSPSVACSHIYDTCLVAFESEFATWKYIRGRYFTINSAIGIESTSEMKDLTNLSGKNPYVAVGKNIGYYMITYTYTVTGVEYPVYNHVYEFPPPDGFSANVNNAKYVLDDFASDPHWLNKNKWATGVAYDPCTEHFIILFDFDYAGNRTKVDVYIAAIHKLFQNTNWSGHIANRNFREESGGISFVTNTSLPPTCGPMNKLVVTYTNYCENKIYAVEVRGNSNTSTPFYDRDVFDNQYSVYIPSNVEVYSTPNIAGGSTRDEMLIVYDYRFPSPDLNYDVLGRLVHVSELLKIHPADGAVDQPLTLTLSWQNIYNIYEYCLGTISGTCNVKDWTSTGTNTSVIFNADPNTTYYWQVRAIDGGNTYANDDTWWSFTTELALLSPFNKTRPINGANVRINPSLEWEESSNADNYEYCYAKTNTCSEWIDNGTDTSTNPNDLEYNTTYYWQVRANKDGDTIYANGSEADFWSFTTPNAGDPVSANFSASTTSGPAPLTVTFTDQSTGDYDTCTWHFGDGTTRTRCGNPIHTYQAVGVYTVELSISGGGGTDTLTRTNYITVTEPITPIPGAFNKFSPINGANVRINPTLRWENSSNADNYEYCYAETNTCSRWIDNGTDTSTTLNDLENNTTYYWQVRATNAEGTTYANDDTWWSFTTPAAGDTVSANFSALPTSGAAPLRVTFTDESTGDYDTCTWDFGDGSTISRCGNPIHTYQAAGVYTVQLSISGVGGTDTLTRRNYITVSEPIVPLPGAFNKISPINGANVRINPTLMWEESRNADNYEYCYAKTNTCSRWIDNGTDTSATLNDLEYNTTYYWQVRAINAKGETYANGSETDFWSFTTAAAGDPVSANFSALPTSGAAPLTVTFFDESTGDYDTCTWHFGDGTTRTRCGNPIHTYQAVGVYTVQLIISGGGGTDTLTRRDYITVTEPIATIPGAFNKISPRNGATKQTISPTLEWEQSRGAASYQYCLAETQSCDTWTDNGTDTSATLNDLEYSTTYYWQVRAINAEGETFANDGTWWSFTTTAPGEQVTADFTASPTSGAAPLRVTFTDESTGDYDTCTWYFGDGATSSRCGNPIHTYQDVGVYTVQLIISGGGGTDTLTRTNYITVSDVGHMIFLPLIQR